MPITFVVPVNGVTFDGRQALLEGLAQEEGPLPVELALEPSNPYDRWAVQVLVNEEHVGYVPREVSQEMTVLVKRGEVLETRVHRLGSFTENLDGRTPERIYYLEIEVMVKGVTE
jgi:hypothetical protein